ETFGRRCAERNVRCDTALEMGIVANEICDQARTADLVVIGHRGVNEQFSTGLLGSTAESVTRKSPRPVFVSPMRFKEISRPLLAYDGSQRASAAMHAAAEVASALSLPLTVLHVVREGNSDGAKVLEEARRYLQSYGLVDDPLQLTEPFAHLGQLLDPPARPLGSRADHLHAPVDGRGEPLQRRLPVLDDLAQHPERQETALASFLFEDDLGERHGGQ